MSTTGPLQNKYSGLRGEIFTPSEHEEVISSLLKIVHSDEGATVHAVGTFVEYTRKDELTLDLVGTSNSYSHHSDDVYVVVEYHLSGYSPANEGTRKVVGDYSAEKKRKELEAHLAGLEAKRAALEEELRVTEGELRSLRSPDSTSPKRR